MRSLLCSQYGAEPHNRILFIPDGLRSQIVDASSAPAFTGVRDEGVNFANSHSLSPTFTTAERLQPSAIA
jgi:hypothetical protein